MEESRQSKTQGSVADKVYSLLPGFDLDAYSSEMMRDVASFKTLKFAAFRLSNHVGSGFKTVFPKLYFHRATVRPTMANQSFAQSGRFQGPHFNFPDDRQ